MSKDYIPTLNGILPNIDKFSWVHKWETRTKIITCIISIFLISSLGTPILVVGIYLILLFMVLSMGLPLRELVRRTSHLLPFLILMAVPIILGGGFPLKRDRVDLALLLAFKGLSSLYIMFLLFFSQPIPMLLNGLAYLKVPDVLMSIIFLSWRYVFILGEKLRKMYKSLVSRLFVPKLNKTTFNAMGEVMGGMIIKSLDTSDIVYKAMLSRGFNGKIPVSRPSKVNFSDILKSLTILISLIIILVFERWWF